MKKLIIWSSLFLIIIMASSCNSTEIISSGSSKLITQPSTTDIQPVIVVTWSGRMLVCNNSANDYTSYQWYLNGQPINGATGQYYAQENGLNGSFYVVVKTLLGTQLQSNTITIHTAP